MKKKLLSVLLSMTVVASLAAGCGSNPENADKPVENTADKQTDNKDDSDDTAASPSP